MPSAATTAAASLPAAPALWMAFARTSAYASAGASRRYRAAGVTSHTLLLRPSVLLPLPLLLLLLAASCHSSSSVSSTAKLGWSLRFRPVDGSTRPRSTRDATLRLPITSNPICCVPRLPPTKLKLSSSRRGSSLAPEVIFRLSGTALSGRHAAGSSGGRSGGSTLGWATLGAGGGLGLRSGLLDFSFAFTGAAFALIFGLGAALGFGPSKPAASQAVKNELRASAAILRIVSFSEPGPLLYFAQLPKAS
mmetsp:Transcript_9504/g.28583  ORF Transcript_9504/g.28583 Transcript_9504/m.28583 type:complete len:250 (-) Transcript_9504:462-1211(-)